MRADLGGVEFDFRVVGDGRSAIARYANNSNYRNDSLIRKESTLFTRLVTGHFRLRHGGLDCGRRMDRMRADGIVCVSSLLVKEIKKIIKESEIMKYVPAWVEGRRTELMRVGKTIRSGRQRTRTDGKSWRFGWGMSTSTLRSVRHVRRMDWTVADGRIDCENWLACRCPRKPGSGGIEGVLLPGSGPEGARVFADCASLQGASFLSASYRLRR